MLRTHLVRMLGCKSTIQIIVNRENPRLYWDVLRARRLRYGKRKFRTQSRALERTFLNNAAAKKDS